VQRLPASLEPISLPLFDRNGSRSPTGGLDCATCHDPHGGALGGAPAGAGSLLRWAGSWDPKLCLDCHKDKQRILGTDHDLRNLALGDDSPAPETESSAAVCRECHRVHNAHQAMALWALRPGHNGNPRDALCLSCHAEGQIGDRKVPTRLTHPDYVPVWSKSPRDMFPPGEAPPTLPVYDERGARAAAGRIACSSCHDPHRWGLGEPADGAGTNREGNAMNSFLRSSVRARLVCADCHGKEAIFLYKYFHGVASRRSVLGAP
jgi:hypothetical protein